MSFARLYKKHNPPKTSREEVDWKVMEVSDYLKMYLDDHKVEHLVSAEYDLRVLVDGLMNHHDPTDPPF